MYLGSEKKETSPGEFPSLVNNLRCGVHNGDGSVKLVTFWLSFVVGCVEVALILILVTWLSRFRSTQWFYAALCNLEYDF
jgi:hypothetical protein